MANTREKQVLLEKVADKRIYKRDPYTVQDGHFIGHDGFVVPKNFAEFYERFPRYVFGWVRKRLNARVYMSEVEDWVQELLLHLSALPLDSKFRKEGKTDVIQTFAPEKMHGANEARFRSYVNRCLANKFNSICVRRRTQPLSNPGNVVLESHPETPGSVSDEYCHAASAQLRRALRRERIHREHEQWLQEFTAFAEARCPGLASVLSAYRTTGTWNGTATSLGLQSGECIERLRLKELGEVFVRR